MISKSVVPAAPATLETLSQFDTCAVTNAIESFAVRLRNEGFTCDAITCQTPDLPPLVGYAVTLRVHSSNPPMEGGSYAQRTDWWDRIEEVPAPRVLVIEDSDRRPGVGAFVGEVHAAILRALGTVAVVTNGAVRDVPAVRRAGFQLFAGSVSVSHAYMHVVEVNEPVVIGGLHIRSGDLLHGDRHGIVSIPAGIADKLPGVLERFRDHEHRIVEFCRSGQFSKDGLRELINQKF